MRFFARFSDATSMASDHASTDTMSVNRIVRFSKEPSKTSRTVVRVSRPASIFLSRC
jgi:hypothetical protein